ncbi:GAF domain-containing sensor histidine kinase [Halalkalicoccus tibetensis]|uniref:histidine kinase n=1 Tax=Halalkalicoccus tibetensis TaxID=175632 RepID=A0ABD5V3L2_9EURY
MAPPVRLAFIGDPGVGEAIDRELGEGVALSTLAPEETVGTAFDCVVSLGWRPDALGDGSRLPTLVLTDDAAAASEGRLAGARVLPTATIDRPEELRAQIEAAAEGEPTPASDRERAPRRPVEDGGVDGGTAVDGPGDGRDAEDDRTRWTLEGLLGATRELMAAEGREEAATVAVSAANRVLGLAHTGVHLADDAGERLEPVAYTEVVEESLGTVPTLERGDCLAWQVLDSGEGRVFEGVQEEEEAHNPETHLRSEMIYPLGEHGVLIVASDSRDAFDDADVYFTELLVETTTAALDRIARESALAGKNARLEEFIGVVSHDLRNPLTVAEGSASLAQETGDLEHLEQVRESHRRMREIIDGLLVLAREGKMVGRRQPVVLGTVAEEAWTNVDTDGATLVVGDDRTVEADRSRLAQLFENAFRNSVEHGSTRSRDPVDPDDSVEHGPTSSRPKADDSVEPCSTCSRDPPDPGDSVEHGSTGDLTVTVEATPTGFAIGDDGPGIDPEERATALEPGYSSEEGTGFGLVIITNIAEGHGWELSLEGSDTGGLRLEFTTDGKGHPDGGR